MKDEQFQNRIRILCFAGVTAVLFLFFALITHWTPACGDDWVYAVGGKWNNPFQQAFYMYQTWSGRYLSELWGFLVAPHKNLWNILNPLFFTCIFLLAVWNGADKENRLVSGLLSAALMLGVGNRVRMQTYTWIMGTTYVIPLLLFLLYVLLLKQWVFTGQLKQKWVYPLMIVLNFCIPLYMENAAALLCGANLLVLLYLWFRAKPLLPKMAWLFAAGFCSTLIILLSPGAAARLNNDNAVFRSLSLMEKIGQNLPYFFEHTFTESRIITVALLLSFTLHSLSQIAKHRLLMVPAALGLCGIFWNNGIVHLLAVLAFLAVTICYEEDEHRRWFLVFTVLCALGANAVMLVSPIFDSRSSLYTEYLFLLSAVIRAQSLLSGSRKARCTAAAASLLRLGIRMISYYDIYHMVHLINIRRYQEIEYYRARPDAGDAWLIAYPDESIHSANVQEGDDTHMYYFKEYYYLNQDLHLVFYYLKDYTAEAIFAPKE